MRLRTVTIGIVAVVLVVLAWSLVAQTQTPNKPAQFLQLTITTVKPSAINDYEEFVKKLNAARDKTAGSPAVAVYAVNLGGPAFTFYTVTQWEKWADREKFPNGGQMLTKVYGEAETARLQKLQRDAIVNQRTEVYAYDADSSLHWRHRHRPRSAGSQLHHVAISASGPLQRRHKPFSASRRRSGIFRDLPIFPTG